MTSSDQQLAGGALNAALANELGKLLADFTGRARPAHGRGTDEHCGSSVEAFILEPQPEAGTAPIELRIGAQE